MNNTDLLNPNTYLNHLSPADARQYEICRNICLITLGATIWDILVYIPDDIHIVKRGPFRFTIFSFIFSRVFAVGYALISVLQRTIPTSNPNTLTIVSSVLCVLAVGCSSFLFLQRVRAVYAGNRQAQWFFSIFWFIYATSEIVKIIGVKPSLIPGTHYFSDAGYQPYVAVGVFVGLLYDTCVFLAISYKIILTHNMSDRHPGLRGLVHRFTSGKALPGLSHAVLQGGQQYYLITAGAMSAIGIIFVLPSVDQMIMAMVSAPLIPLIASMACRVFRNLKSYDLNTPRMDIMSPVQFV
ncbi:hypothetical protein P691DRAFT_740266 [Macrolepiota fuliginosa MF-IS2]|uniref:Uncharacterized protein n=1 Tax=Macrolepiota fuliginosa MF-IS2 TaxID=1400762 RepID=A0A9P5WXQ5_9AGAR|nr:hypothetical protein P691DRAFT_740266 [Macrolepiota fuliginosa MF-IS2]